MTTKYLKSGEKVLLIQELESGFLVDGYMTIQGYDGEMEEWLADRPHVVAEVYHAPPSAVIDKTVASLRRQEQDLRSQRAALMKEIDELEVKYSKTVDKFGIVEQLRPLEQYLDGKMVTHLFVTDQYGRPRIEDAEIVNQYRHTKGLRLLSLYGDSKGDLLWNVNRYKDESGDSVEVVPCFSREEAVSELKEFVIECLKSEDRYRSVADLAKRHGVKMPTGYMIDLLQKENDYDLKTIARAEKDIKTAKDKIAARG